MLKNRENIYRERGAVMIFMAMIIVVIIGLIGLAIDTSVVLLTVNVAQASADAATLAAMSALRNPSQLVGWQNIKKAVLGALAGNPLRSLNAAAESSLAIANSGDPTKSFRYTLGAGTPYDTGGYDFTTGQVGNLSVAVGRGLFCYEPDPSAPSGFDRRWYSLEGTTPANLQPAYCLANSVKVHLEIYDLKTWFIRVLGAANVPKLHIESTAYLKAPNTCGFPLCSTVGTPAASSDEFGQQFIPAVPCP